MIKAGIIGSTGYAGGELARLLLQREDVEIKWYGSRSYIDQKYASVYQNMFKLVDAECMDDNMKELAEQVDVVFTATPQGLCSTLVNEDVLSKVKIIDLSADFRIKDVEIYKQWYKLEYNIHQNKRNQKNVTPFVISDCFTAFLLHNASCPLLFIFHRVHSIPSRTSFCANLLSALRFTPLTAFSPSGDRYKDSRTRRSGRRGLLF